MRERDIEFFQPLWRRIAVVVFCIAWSIVEWVGQEPFWGVVTAGLAFYCYWRLIHTFEEDNGTSKH